VRREKTASLQSMYWGLLVFGLVSAVVGYFGPWVFHRAAALTVTGFELSWFAKFFPQVGSGSVPVKREQFFAPLVAASLLCGLWINRFARWSIVPRILMTGVAASLLLLALPPYDFFLAPEYRRQLMLVAAALAMAPLTLLARGLPRCVWAGLFALLALMGSSLAQIQFVRLRPLVVALYGGPVGLGWGAIACTAGFVSILVLGILSGSVRAEAAPGEGTSLRDLASLGWDSRERDA
jgi:hypothetical protein